MKQTMIDHAKKSGYVPGKLVLIPYSAGLLGNTKPPAGFADEAQPLYAQPPADNLACKSVQKRLATQWGYVKANEPPAAQVPDEMPTLERAAIEDYSHGYRAGWNACRAAMLATAPTHKESKT